MSSGGGLEPHQEGQGQQSGRNSPADSRGRSRGRGRWARLEGVSTATREPEAEWQSDPYKDAGRESVRGAETDSAGEEAHKTPAVSYWRPRG